MIRKLFLTSAGLPQETAPFFLQMLGKNPEGMKAAVIPTAGYPEIIKIHLDEIKRGLKGFGFKVEVIDLKIEDPRTIKNGLEKADIICVGGGNTFFLLYWVRKCGLDEYFGDLLNQGKIYLGISAGSILVGPNIKSSSWCHEPDINVVNLKDLTGLNFIPFAISPHYTEADRSLLEEKAKNVNYPIIAINDTQAVQVIGDEYKIVGAGKEVKFNF